MKWDEDVYGREYDLDIFQIVAVSDFNMGAMENKGLNIFNTSAVLCSPETSTDANFERIEAIIAHEYFHNWTGNRITCRDWFQLSLKEGLTVFRDQSFSADMRSPSVCRISDVLSLRGRQFREDNGPLAHQVQPDSFVEINNFYTSTIYEKGAEVIRCSRRSWATKATKGARPLFRPPRWAGLHHRRLAHGVSGCDRARSRPVQTLVQAGGHAASAGERGLERRHLSTDLHANDPAHTRSGGEGTLRHPHRGRSHRPERGRSGRDAGA